jgi:type IV secretory pathway protease TraF
MRLWAPLATLVLVTSFSAMAIAQSASIDRGALVLVKDAQNRLSVRSVVAVSGDVVAVSDGRVAVNGMPINIGQAMGAAPTY